MSETDFSCDWKTVKIKADLLCLGLRPNEITKMIYSRQNPCQDWKTGNVGVHISLEGGSHVLATISHSFDKRSPYSIEHKDETLSLLRGKKIVGTVEEVPMPHWYSRKTKSQSPMPRFFLHEGRKFLHQAYSGCDYHSIGLQCKFCGTGADWAIGTPLEIAETVAEATAENPNYHICLGGGTRLPRNRNVNYFSECAREIRKRTAKARLWIEMTPPEYDSSIARLVESGATSFGFNIEIWDDIARSTICPGKSSISKERYLGALETSLDILGPNRVGSCLLVGLEPIESSIKGVEALTSIGVQPCLLPFKPWDGSEFGGRAPCSPDDLIRVSKTAVGEMSKNDVYPHENEGCLHCEGCTIDHDIYKLMTE